MSQERVQYVTLGVDRDIFGLPVAVVREILDRSEISRLPQAPSYVLGVIDVRGEGVPVIDLRVKLGLPKIGSTDVTRIVVLEVAREPKPLVLGLLVDQVFEVTELDGGTLEPPPSTGGRWRADCIAGIGRRGRNFVVVLDLPHLLAEDDAALAADPADRAA
jgi:purine-binding chemotaxis protein CheW